MHIDTKAMYTYIPHLQNYAHLQNYPYKTAYNIPVLKSDDQYCAVAKSPMYELGNLRRLRMVRSSECPSLGHHKGYIVMSTRGQRPEPDKIFGADCDGDIALVIVNRD